MRVMASQILGSPPHTRGTRSACKVIITTSRITPAYAGNTTLDDRYRCVAQDHPRIRGEHSYGGELDDIRYGSPPHTRGTR